MKPFWSISEACVWAATVDLDAVDAVSNGDPEDVHWLMPARRRTPTAARYGVHSSLRVGRPSGREPRSRSPHSAVRGV